MVFVLDSRAGGGLFFIRVLLVLEVGGGLLLLALALLRLGTLEHEFLAVRHSISREIVQLLFL